MIDAFRKGFDLWKRAMLTQLGVLVIIGFIGIFVVTPFGFLIAINAQDGGVGQVNTAPDRLLIDSFLEAVSVDTGFWLSILATTIVVAIINTMIVGAVQKTAHDYAETGAGRFGDTLKALLPMIIPLAIVAIVSGIIVALPTWIGAEIFNRFSDPNQPIILSFSFLFIPLSLTITEIIATLALILIFTLLGGPYFLAITAVAADKAGINGIVEGWKLYYRKPLSTMGAMVFVFIIALVNAVVLLAPINGIVIAGDNLSQILLNVFLLMTLGLMTLFFVNNYVYTSMYKFYRGIKE